MAAVACFPPRKASMTCCCVRLDYTFNCVINKIRVLHCVRTAPRLFLLVGADGGIGIFLRLSICLCLCNAQENLL